MPLYVAGPGSVHSTLEQSPVALGAQVSDVALVSVDTLDNILRQHAAGRRVDLLSIDVEGHELAVLQGITLERWRPRLILLEDHVTDLRKHRAMVRRGYQILRRTGLNSWYVPRELPVRFSWRARAEFVRKYFLGLPFRKLKYAKR